MDALSEILAAMRPTSSLSAGLAAGGQWAIDFGPPAGVKFNAVLSGRCWLAVDGAPALQLQEGDCFLLTQPRSFVLASDLSLPRLSASAIYDHAVDGVASCNSGEDFLLIGGRFAFGGSYADLFGALPPVIKVDAASPNANVLKWSLSQLAAELKETWVGRHLVAEHLAHIMLVQILRLYLDEQRDLPPGWMKALADPQIRRAMASLHAEPARRWSVAELARTAGMSRSSFAEAFRQAAGLAPIEYLTRWRMTLAQDRLRTTSDSVAAIAFGLGYRSESAFSTAFKRATALSPLQFRHRSVSA